MKLSGNNNNQYFDITHYLKKCLGREPPSCVERAIKVSELEKSISLEICFNINIL